MKKTVILFIFSALYINSFAQSSLLLPSSVGIPNVSVMPTCNISAKGNQVFNTVDNKMYFCNGTAWTDMTVGGFTLPYSGSGNIVAPNILFNITNSANGRAITGETTSPTYGTGVYGVASNTAPSSASPTTNGIFGINKSQNANGYGIYGQHDGSGKGILGGVMGNGIGVHGISFPVSSGGTGGGIGVLGESNSNYGVQGTSVGSYGVYGLSTNNSGVRAESSNGYGIYASSNTGTGIYASSNTGTGIYSYSGASNAGYFENSSSGSTIYANNYGTGKAANLQGDVLVGQNLDVSGSETIGSNLTVSGNEAITGSLTVNSNKGVAYNASSSNNLRIYRFTTANFHAILGPHGSAVTSIAFTGGFTSTPTVVVGDIESTGGTVGELDRVILVLRGCTYSAGTTTCTAKIINTDSASVDYNITWNCVAFGY